MAQTTLLYTCIPDPTYQGPGLRVTVLISPRLTGATELSAFPDILSWPWAVDDLWMDARIGGQRVHARIAQPRRETEDRDLALWRHIFPPECPVESWWFRDESDRALWRFPATDVIDRLLGVYRSVAAAGTEPPRILDVGDLPGCDPVPGVPDDALACHAPDYVPTPADRLLLDLEAATAAVDDPQRIAALSPEARALFDGLRFYKRGAMMAEPPIQPPVLDFHARVGLLGDHPTLLRRLGLAFDVVLDVDRWALPSIGPVELVPMWRGEDHPEDLCPETFYDLSTGVFRVAGVGPAIADGYLRLRDPAFSVVQLDGDGALTACMSTVASVRRLLTDPHSPPEHAQALPALRSAGLTVVHRGRDGWLRWRWNRHQMMQRDPRNAVLFSEDVYRGYRFDIEDVDHPGVWRSLHRRHGTVHAASDGRALVPIPPGQDEEGYVKLVSGTASTPTARELYLHESVAGWSGWSLSARRPGKTTTFVPAVELAGTVIEEAHDAPVDDANAPGTLPVFTEYRATPASLPRLRFGRRYRIRARAVDLAGGSLPLADPADHHASEPVTYQRFEPVPGPTLVQRTPIHEGESAEHLVVRTEPGVARDYQVLRNERHVLAPKASLEMWEQHGMLDGLPVAERYNLSRRECGTLLDAEIYTVADAPIPVAHRELRNGPSAVEPYGTWPARRGDPLEQGQYVLHTGERVRLPWLADPACGGVCLWDPRHPAATIVFRLFQPHPEAPPATRWHEPDSMMIVLHAAAAGTTPAMRPGAPRDREIHVDLPPGEQLELRYASIPSDRWLDAMAMWNLLTDADRTGDLVTSIREGRHPMFTPSRTLTLTHAAQRPVEAPRFTGPLTVIRMLGEGRVRIDGELATHAPSTSHVDVRATWREVADDAAHGATEPVVGSDAFRVAIGDQDIVTPTTQPREVANRRPAEVTGAQGVKLGKLLRIRRNQHVEPSVHELPDGKRRIVTYTPVGTTRWQEFFPLEVIADPGPADVPIKQTALQRIGEATRPTSIPASLAPDAPVVTAVLPTFARSGQGASRTRRGNGLRIYLDRPWFSTGVGERLAILLPDPQSAIETSDPRVSRWGADPVWSRGAPSRLVRDSFVIDPADTAPAFGGLPERPRVEALSRIGSWLGDAIVVVPEFSVDRQQWYADVELISDGYFPFVSLALARYQEHTVDDNVLALSPVVRAEMVQLAPDRVASIAVSPSGRRIDVAVRGVSAGNRLESQGPLPPPGIGDDMNGRPGGGHRMRVRCEYPDTRANRTSELDWRVHSVGELVGRWIGGEIEWTGSITARPGVPWRVVIEESEVYAGEDHGADPAIAGERITYVEILTPT